MTTKRRCSEIGEAVDGSKRISSTAAANIDDLPIDLLAEILSRLPCCKFITRCKCVSKRWGTLIPYLILQDSFVVRFLSHHCCQAPALTPTLISIQGEEFLTRMSGSPKPLDHLFKKLMSFHHLEREPVVVATFNDLVLCCATMFLQMDYYICNPFTNQWVALPRPPPQVYTHVKVGFICDVPYYKYIKKDDQGEHVIQLNAKYNCKVVRLICPDNELELLSNEFKVQIFSSDTSEWRELTVFSPFKFSFEDIDYKIVACNGMLYWWGYYFLIGLDPFIKKSNSSSSFCTSSSSSTSEDDFTTESTEHNYRCHFIEIDESANYNGLECLGVTGGGCLKLAYYNYLGTMSLCDLNVDQMANNIYGERSGAYCKVSNEMVNSYQVDKKMRELEQDWNDCAYFYQYAFDPSDGDILYLRVYQDIIMCNNRTREWSKIFDQNPRIHSLKTKFFPLVIPSWPTPPPIAG